MSRTSFLASSALVSLVLSQAAQAAVTPEQVWQNWQDISAGYGQTLSAGATSRSGDTLIVTDIDFGMAQDELTVKGSLDEVRFRDLGDGRVEVTLSDTYPLQITTPAETDGLRQIDMTFSQPGMKMIASGDETQTEYRFDGPDLKLTASAKMNDQSLAEIAATIAGMAGSYTVITRGGQTEVSSDFNIETLNFTVDANAQDNGNRVTASGTLADIAAMTGGTFLGLADMENPALALSKGFATNTDLRYGAGNFVIDVTEPAGLTKVEASSDSGHFKFSLAGDAMSYAAGGKGVAITASGSQIPFPELKLNYAEAAFDFLMPLTKSQSPQNFTLLTRIVDLTVSDEIWAMIDPGATLPRDPATLIIDTKGTAQLHTNLMDEAAMASLGEGAPGDLHSLDLNDLTVKFAGAELTGSGAFTFDNTDKTTYDGIPAPTGKLEVVLKGGNALLDKLAALGLVTDEQLQQARFGLMMFTREGTGPDARATTLEFQDKGFSVNGMKLQ